MKVYSAAEHSTCSDEKCAALRKIPFFALFKDDNELRQVLSFGNWMECPADTTLIHEGSVESTMFVLIRGEVQVEKKGKPLATVKAPGIVGEIGAFLDTPRTADVRTRDTATIFGLNVKHLGKLPGESLYRVMEYLFRITAVRLVHTDQRMASL
jgi:CRP-like cAMP-binding protein